MQDTVIDPPCDSCDERLKMSKNQNWSESQLRFLDAYQQTLVIAQSAQLGGVHRATVYRWRTDPAFAEAMRAAADAYFRNSRAKWEKMEAARKVRRQARERELYPMRCRNLAKARAAKLRKQALRGC